MSTDNLAILGGSKLREKPFIVEPMVDELEEKLVLEAVRARSFSRYIGAKIADMDRVLRMPSAETIKVTDYWHPLGGEHVRHFGAEFADAFRCKYAIPVTSATAGISLALAACGVGPGDEVIVPALSYSASASAVLMFNSIPVFADVDPWTFCLDPAAVERAITPRTKAILPVHLTGNLADMDALLAIAKRHNLRIIEDAAQAIGASWRDRKAGTVGDAGVYSFQQSKNIMTGEGGMVVTDDPEIARRVRLILNHGEVVFDDNDADEDLANIVGFNFRMPELCAAVGRAQLAKLKAVNDWRTNNADILRKGLGGLPGIVLPPSQRHGNGPAKDMPHLFVAIYDEAAMGVSRDVFVAAVRAEGIAIGTGYNRPMYHNPMFLRRIAYGAKGCPWTCHDSKVEYKKGMCPTAERLVDQQFLWFYQISYPSTPADMEETVAGVRKVIANLDALKANAAAIAAQAVHATGRIGVQPSARKAS
jgi:perosamine synthetase